LERKDIERGAKMYWTGRIIIPQRCPLLCDLPGHRIMALEKWWECLMGGSP
jgi:hypothetical protein